MTKETPLCQNKSMADIRTQAQIESGVEALLEIQGGSRLDAKFQAVVREVIAQLEVAKTADINSPSTVNYTEPTTGQNMIFQIQRGPEKLELSAPGVSGAKVAKFKVNSEIDPDIIILILKGFISCVAGNQARKDLIAATPTRSDLKTLHDGEVK